MSIKRYGNHGLVFNGDTAALSFEIISASDQLTIDEERSSLSNMLIVGDFFAYGNYTVASFGIDNNLPVEIREMLKLNPYLPELLKKQVRFIHGMGPALFTEEIQPDGKMKYKPVTRETYPQVWAWLESWQQNGIPNSYREYLGLVTLEYYYMEGYFSKWHYNKSRRTGGKQPVRGLEFIPSQRARLASNGVKQIQELIEDGELQTMLVTRWDKPYRIDAEAFPRFDPANPFRYPVAINYVRDRGFGEEIYSYPTFYYGLREWIKSSNLNPKYINSYLKNSLSAKLHVVIPDKWITTKEQKLRDICTENQSREIKGTALIDKYEGVDVGTTFDYALVQKLIDKKLDELLSVLSGEGENQGKTFVSRSFRTEHGIEEWDFKEIPIKYKEFVESIITIDKRSVEVITAGKGLPPSISNLSKDGIFQSSGSDTYYNYLIYLSSLYYAEEFIFSDINMALHINFPELKKANIKLRFLRNAPERQQDVQPEQRLDKTA